MFDTQTTPQQLGVLSVHKSNCLRCSHLVEWAASEYDCTAPSNPHCPAACVKIVIGFNIDVVADAIRAGMQSGNADVIAGHMEKLRKYSPEIQQQVLAKVNSKPDPS